LSLGTMAATHETALADCVQRVRASGALLVAAAPQPGVRWLPGALPGVVAVELDWTLARDVCRAELSSSGELHVWASGYPRPIPGVPPERNLKGISFAVANATGLLARAASGRSDHLLRAIAGALVDLSGTVPS
jgi:hypothetical protein